MLLQLLEKMVDVYFSVVPRHKPSLELSQSAHLIAHRGAHNKAQGIIENTLAAFDRAQDLGCWGIEFDVRATADNVLIVNHDPTLKRLWGYDLPISQLSFKELRSLAPDIPSLKEVITAYGQIMHLFIELKTPFHNEEVLAQTLDGLTAGENYYLLTLNPSVFRSLSLFPKYALLLVAGSNNVNKFCEISLKENYGGVLGHYFLMNNKLINKLKTAHKIVGVGMVDSKSSLYRELNRGVDWLFTDRAVEIQSYLRCI